MCLFDQLCAINKNPSRTTRKAKIFHHGYLMITHEMIFLHVDRNVGKLMLI